ncbi:tyrosine-type recombinase/integrase [Streptomyces luteogriseus]|uniref:tyrosine-type recombinase/integrase n=1 Tax=Streptomyces luteogriseus TaxID=68233 RepID=UPI0038306151
MAISCAAQAATTRNRWNAAVCRSSSRTSLPGTVSACTASVYGFRHYFASNALGNGIPITDVAEWMGHKSIEETYRTYRHLMPGSITKAACIRRPVGRCLRPPRSLSGLLCAVAREHCRP